LNPMGVEQRGKALVLRCKRFEPIPLGHRDSILRREFLHILAIV